MLREQHASVEKFFDHEDEEKQFFSADLTINKFRNSRHPYESLWVIMISAFAESPVIDTAMSYLLSMLSLNPTA
ncbi:hypothetical protein [Lacrimispora sphenoides]|uniref:hypothetical protein n=1 Tax=Lacrimispora sphenoides TaxID=29370 RepID=UPI0006D244AE|nr:hypothetical protein [Lacrimispora sphenoides]